MYVPQICITDEVNGGERWKMVIEPDARKVFETS